MFISLTGKRPTGNRYGSLRTMQKNKAPSGGRCRLPVFLDLSAADSHQSKRRCEFLHIIFVEYTVITVLIGIGSRYTF